jgi:hypothetical protein
VACRDLNISRNNFRIFGLEGKHDEAGHRPANVSAPTTDVCRVLDGQ